MTTDRVHAPDPGEPSWPLCGVYHGWTVSTNVDDVTCAHCLRRLGVTRAPKDALVDAVLAWHAEYVVDGDPAAVRARDGDFGRSTPAPARESKLCAAVDEYQRRTKTSERKWVSP